MAAERFKSIHDRLIFIDERIRAGTARSAGDLASDYEVSTRTVRRDLEYLRDSLGAPIEYDRVHGGYWYRDPGYRFQNVAMSAEDLFAVYLADRVLEQYRNTPLYPELQVIFDRLKALVPSRKVTLHAALARERFSVFVDPVARLDASVWKLVFDSLSSERVLEVSYSTPGKTESVTRKVHPYHVVAYRGDWYLIGFSVHDRDVRMYALSRMREVEVLNDRFPFPAEFSFEEYFENHFGIFAAEDDYSVTVRFSASQAPYIREREWQHGQSIEELGTGEINLRFHTGHLYEVARWILSWGPDAEVIEPPELRKMVSTQCCAAANLYNREA